MDTRLSDHAHLVTYSGAGGAFVFAGLTLDNIAVLVSMLCAIIGVIIQLTLARAKIREMEARQYAQEATVRAVAASNRAVERKADAADVKADVAIDIAKQK